MLLLPAHNDQSVGLQQLFSLRRPLGVQHPGDPADPAVRRGPGANGPGPDRYARALSLTN